MTKDALETRVNAMIAGTLDTPSSLRPLAETYRKLDEYLVDPKKLVGELNRSLVAMIKAADAAKIEIPVTILITTAEVPPCMRAAVAAHARLQEYYADSSKLENDCNQLFDAMIAAVSMMEAFASLSSILAVHTAVIDPPAKIHAVPAARVPGSPVRRAV